MTRIKEIISKYSVDMALVKIYACVKIKQKVTSMSFERK